jgi:CDP-diacylglycerol--serine O-phosphatidyltransferase
MPAKKFTRHIPNLFTLGNLLLGCLGIIYAFNDHMFPVELKELDPGGKNLGVIFGFNNRLYLSSFMIFGAAVLDFFDGFIARLLKAQSPFGTQLDSLADAVTFGVLPGCIFYQLLAAAFHLEPGALYVPIICLMPAFLIPICSVCRLAKFNIDERQQSGFIGLATPAMALFTASLPLIIFTDAYHLAPVILNKWILYGIIVIFSWLMVSNIPMFSLKIKTLGWKGNELRVIFFLFGIFFISFFKYTGIAATILLYVLLCLVQHLFFKQQAESDTLS